VAAGPGSPPKTLMLTELVNYFTVSDLVWIDFWWHFFMAIKLIMIKLISGLVGLDLFRLISQQLLNNSSAYISVTGQT
jgi:hypothetical protein